MKYNILILEDDENRMVEFYDRFKGAESADVEFLINHAETAEEAINFLKSTTYDLIFLDHDLGGETYVDVNNKNTGSEVARFMNESEIEFNGNIIIHSMNDIAAENMLKLIKPKNRFTIKVQGIWFKRIFDEVIEIS